MLEATEDERQTVIDYFNLQASEMIVEFVRQVFEEHVLSYRHDVWDIHTNKGRW
jgi:hypothetical protein